jgi:hypothetical protein
MIQNVSSDQYAPRIVMALAAGVGAAFIPGTLAKTGLFAAAAGLLASVATGYCPVTAAVARQEPEEAPHWHTLKTYQVQP